jgi:hypothetical protein
MKVKLLDVVLTECRKTARTMMALTPTPPSLQARMSALIPDLLEALGGELSMDGEAPPAAKYPKPCCSGIDFIKEQRPTRNHLIVQACAVWLRPIFA